MRLAHMGQRALNICCNVDQAAKASVATAPRQYGQVTRANPPVVAATAEFRWTAWAVRAGSVDALVGIRATGPARRVREGLNKAACQGIGRRESMGRMTPGARRMLDGITGHAGAHHIALGPGPPVCESGGSTSLNKSADSVPVR